MKSMRYLLLCMTFLLLMSAQLIAAHAQMMLGASDEPKKEDKAAQTSQTPANPAYDQPDRFSRLWKQIMGPESPYRPIILSVLTLLILLRLKSYSTKRVQKYVNENAFVKDNATSFMKVWRATWFFATAILVVIAMSGSIKVLGLTAGFIGMILGWSLQQPVTGIAAWLMIVLKKPFQIGDRVIIAGITGDVTGITLTHVILNQVGGSIGGEERSGRGILIPNAILFQQTIINYTLEQKYMLDEVPVRLSFDCDWEEAKRLMLEAANEATKDVITESNAEPFVRVELLDWGLLARLRFNTIPMNRQEISTRVIESLIQKFHNAYPRVRFAIPASSIRYRRDISDEGASIPAESGA